MAEPWTGKHLKADDVGDPQLAVPFFSMEACDGALALQSTPTANKRGES